MSFFTLRFFLFFFISCSLIFLPTTSWAEAVPAAPPAKKALQKKHHRPRFKKWNPIPKKAVRLARKASPQKIQQTTAKGMALLKIFLFLWAIWAICWLVVIILGLALSLQFLWVLGLVVALFPGLILIAILLFIALFKVETN